jgi:hypothetical protein
MAFKSLLFALSVSVLASFVIAQTPLTPGGEPNSTWQSCEQTEPRPTMQI